MSIAPVLTLEGKQFFIAFRELFGRFRFEGNRHELSPLPRRPANKQ